MKDEQLIQVVPSPRQIALQQIAQSQRVERFRLEIPDGDEWKPIAEGTVIGYKRIIPVHGLRTACLRLVIGDARVRPTIAFLGVYQDRI